MIHINRPEPACPELVEWVEGRLNPFIAWISEKAGVAGFFVDLAKGVLRMRALSFHPPCMSILRQRDLSSDDMQLALGRRMPGGKDLNAHNRRGVKVDEDGETSSLTTLLEQARERLDESTVLDLVRRSV